MPDKEAEHWEAVEDAAELLVEGSFEEALAQLGRVIEGDAGNPYAYHYLGAALYELGRLEPARDAYRAAVRLAPDYLSARLGLSHVLRLLGAAGAAAAEAAEALRRFPDDGDALHAAGLAHLAQGNIATARRYLTAFLQTKPEPEIQLEIVSLLGALDQDAQDAQGEA